VVGNSNGDGVQQDNVDVLTITYHPDTDKMEIGGACFSLNRMLMMVERAHRQLDAQWKIVFMQEQQATAGEQARVQEIMRRTGLKG